MSFPMPRRRPAAAVSPPERSIVGTEIESRCRKCKASTSHVVVAKVGSKPTRVRCSTCETEHEHSTPRPRRTAETIAQPRSWAEAVAGAQGASAPYSSGTSYRVGARVAHTSFGEGIVVRLSSPTVCEVLFEARTVKLLMTAPPTGFDAPQPPASPSRRMRRFL